MDTENQPSAAQESIRERILAERNKGNVVFMVMDHQLMAAPLDEFVTQPVDGILYDLNRSEEVVMTFIDNPKWVNDFAVAQVIRKLVAQRDEFQKDVETWKERAKSHGWYDIMSGGATCP